MINKYNISFTMYLIEDGKINPYSHFSGCRAEVEGECFEDAVEKFSRKNREEGYVVMGVVEGDIFKAKFYNIETK